MANFSTKFSKFRDEDNPEVALTNIANDLGLGVFDEKFAIEMDQADKLGQFREKFTYPKMKDIPTVDQSLVKLDDDCIYLCGNSLGLKPKSADNHMHQVMQEWGKFGVMSHFVGGLPAAACDKPGLEMTAKLVGACPKEVALMNGLTVNLHLLMISFYRPTSERYKILTEDCAFPSDRYAVKSQIDFHGYDPDTALVALPPRTGENTLRTSDILDFIEAHGHSIALILFSGVHYYTGQKFDMEAITRIGHSKGCMVGFDLAHAIGNVKLELHQWDVDFACWCSYKYVNSGAGGLAGIFVHEKFNRKKFPQLHGWWSNKASTRFNMGKDIDVAEGAAGFRLCNPPPFLACINLASLEIFAQTSMEELVAKQYLLTGYLETMINRNWPKRQSINCNKSDLTEISLKIITPSDPNQRGNQLSLMFNCNVETINRELERRGAITDIRLPNVIRVAPAPLYNSFYDVYLFIETLKEVIRLSTKNK